MALLTTSCATKVFSSSPKVKRSEVHKMWLLFRGIHLLRDNTLAHGHYDPIALAQLGKYETMPHQPYIYWTWHQMASSCSQTWIICFMSVIYLMTRTWLLNWRHGCWPKWRSSAISRSGRWKETGELGVLFGVGGWQWTQRGGLKFTPVSTQVAWFLYSRMQNLLTKLRTFWQHYSSVQYFDTLNYHILFCKLQLGDSSFAKISL